MKLRKQIKSFFKFLLFRFVFQKKELKRKKIFFNVFQNNFTCNPKYIANEILRRKLPYELVWTVGRSKNITKNFPKEIKLVRRNSIRALYEASTSKFWIDNAINFFYDNLPKREGQILINTWHGSLGLKRIGQNDNKNQTWLKNAIRCNHETDFLISNSSFESEIYRQTYWPDVPILNYGHPRNDLLFNTQECQNLKKKVCNEFHIPFYKKLALYAPTFRDAQNLEPYDLNFSMLREALTKKFGGEWVILSRQHYKLAKQSSGFFEYDNNIVDATSYPDIQELLLVSDIGITDYSSWICDFVLTGKPGFIYATDLKKYDSERGFYYPLETTPFPIATNNEEMEQNILNFDNELYQSKKLSFLRDRGCWEDGQAAARVVDKIVELAESKS